MTKRSGSSIQKISWGVLVLLLVLGCVVDGQTRPRRQRQKEIDNESNSPDIQSDYGNLLIRRERDILSRWNKANMISDKELLSFEKCESLTDFLREHNMENHVSFPTEKPGKKIITIKPNGDEEVYIPNPKNGMCAPETTTVCSMPNDMYEQQAIPFPQCIKIQKCGGCSCQGGKKCLPTKQEKWHVQMIDYRSRIARRSLEPNMLMNRTETNHLKCGCRCETLGEECSEDQDFDDINCRCICRDKKDGMPKKKCIKSRRHFWSEVQCKCYCASNIGPENCSQGIQRFDEDKCTCVDNSRQYQKSLREAARSYKSGRAYNG